MTARTSSRSRRSELQERKRQALAVRKAQALVSDPAVYRLDFTLRSLATLALVSGVLDVMSDFQVPFLRQWHGLLRVGPAADRALNSWVATLGVRQIFGFFLLWVTWRCVKQLERDQARELMSTLPAITPTYICIIVMDLVTIPFTLAVTEAKAVGVHAFDNTMVAVAALCVMIVALRHHVRQASPMLLARAQRAPEGSARARYVPLKYVFLICAALAIVLNAAGYLLAGKQ
jgi:hypothetical protein